MTIAQLMAHSAGLSGWRGAEIPAANGQGNARSVAMVQTLVANGGISAGKRVLSEAGVRRVLEEQIMGDDLVLAMPVRYGMGLACPARPFPIANTAFWGGYGGSLVIAALIVAPAVAQTAATPTKPDQRTLALAAGWKALFLCSGTFLAGMKEADIAANDLEGGYPELQPHIAALPATLSSSARTVSVGFDPALAQLGYGRAIWLMGAAAGLPDGSYGFNGNRGQYALIVPSARLVVVRRGFDPTGAGFDQVALTRDVLAALASPAPTR